MDHFGPAWGSFPATDKYDPTRLWLACVSLALRFGNVPGAGPLTSDAELARDVPSPPTGGSSLAMAPSPDAVAAL